MRKRSSYKPRPLINPLTRVLERCSMVKSHEGAVTLKIKNHQALLDVTQGRGTRNAIDILIAAMNVSEALYRVNPDLGADIREDIRAAQDALYTMCRRGAATGRFVFTGEELQAMNLGMDIHDAQLDACTILDLENANALVQKELRSKKVRKINEPTGNEV
jgi:hypothetical protein